MRQMTLFSMADQDKTFNALCDSLGCENNTPGWPDQFGRAISAWLDKDGARAACIPAGVYVVVENTAE